MPDLYTFFVKKRGSIFTDVMNGPVGYFSFIDNCQYCIFSTKIMSAFEKNYNFYLFYVEITFSIGASGSQL